MLPMFTRRPVHFTELFSTTDLTMGEMKINARATSITNTDKKMRKPLKTFLTMRR
jgi:hypothetical protein